MNHLFLLAVITMTASPIEFERHEIDTFPAGYQVVVADVNGNGRPDVIALSTEADRVDWYENPTWKRWPIARTARNIDLVPCDVNGDGRIEIALASGFHFSESSRGGNIQLLTQPKKPGDLWNLHPIAVDPVVHRLRWGDLSGDGRPELIHAPLFSSGSDGTRDPKPAHLWAFRMPGKLGTGKLGTGKWDTWKIDETLTVIHGLHVSDLDGDGRDEILTASFEGIHRYDFKGKGPEARWQKVKISDGAKPADDKPGTARGSSEVVPGNLGRNRPFLAAIEPWHGNQVVIYTPDGKDRPWRRRVLDDKLDQGHALVVADFDGDGMDEIVAGWRGGDGGLVLYDPADDGSSFTRIEIERGITVDGAVAADINLNGRLDLVVIAGRSNRLVWYENRGWRGHAARSSNKPDGSNSTMNDSPANCKAKLKILFLCTGNSCRSQMAEGWARKLKGDVLEPYSAGIETHGLNPRAVAVVAEAGVDISGHQSKRVDQLAHVALDVVVTVCGHANETCPVFPGAPRVVHVGFDDPPRLAKSATTEEEALAHYRRVRDEIRAFVEQLPQSLD